MSTKDRPTLDAAELRRQAEELVRSKETGQLDLEAMTPEEARQTLHELRVHKIELEAQNSELRRAQMELAVERQRCDACRPVLCKPVDACFLNNDSHNRSGCELTNLEITTAAQCQRDRVAIRIRAVLVGEYAEFHGAIDVILQETIRRDGISPKLIVLVGGVDAQRLVVLVEVPAG